jgi:hypothetical protein
MSKCALDPKTLALVSLAANIAANHPKKGICQLERLRSYGVPEAQIDLVVDIARHLRDEAGQMLDQEFAAVSAPGSTKPKTVALSLASATGQCDCSTTPNGNPCC